MKKQDFNQGWQFERMSALKMAAVSVTLPHDAMLHETRQLDCANGRTTGYYPGGTYRYTKTFTQDNAWKEQTVQLEFEGVYRPAPGETVRPPEPDRQHKRRMIPPTQARRHLGFRLMLVRGRTAS